MENKETVIVTGGTGFIGVHCILQLLQKDPLPVKLISTDRRGMLRTKKSN